MRWRTKSELHEDFFGNRSELMLLLNYFSDRKRHYACYCGFLSAAEVKPALASDCIRVRPVDTV